MAKYINYSGVMCVIIDLRLVRKYLVLSSLLLLALFLLLNSKWFLRKVYPIHYGELISRYADQYEVDRFLVTSIIRVESGFRTGAESSKGARGLMQIMPETGRWVAREIGLEKFDDDMLFDPEVNIRVGTWYLRSLNQEFMRDRVIVLAAYNGGLGNVRSWLAEEQWTGKAEEVEQIPFPETRAYVRRVLAAYHRYKQIYQGGIR